MHGCAMGSPVRPVVANLCIEEIEKKRIIKLCTKGSNVAKRTWTFNHFIVFNNPKIIDKANNRSRKTLKSWHTAETAGADNNSCLLPRQYLILLKKH